MTLCPRDSNARLASKRPQSPKNTEYLTDVIYGHTSLMLMSLIPEVGLPLGMAPCCENGMGLISPTE